MLKKLEGKMNMKDFLKTQIEFLEMYTGMKTTSDRINTSCKR